MYLIFEVIIYSIAFLGNFIALAVAIHLRLEDNREQNIEDEDMESNTIKNIEQNNDIRDKNIRKFTSGYSNGNTSTIQEQNPAKIMKRKKEMRKEILDMNEMRSKVDNFHYLTDTVPDNRWQPDAGKDSYSVDFSPLQKTRIA